MKQTCLMSLIESITNVAVGYGIAVVTQLIVFPWFGLPARIGDALAIGAIYTGISIIRSFALRRMFEAIRIRSAQRQTAAREGDGCVGADRRVRPAGVCTRAPAGHPSRR